MKISIALATYNGENYIEDQLRSFLLQTHQPDELIICDDFSTDRTIEIVRNFAKKVPFKVTLILNKNNIGYAQNFSKALIQCSGDIVFMSDQDDVWHENKIEKMIARFEQEPLLQLLIHDLDYCKEDLTRIGQTKIERMDGNFNIQRNYVVGMATAIRGSFLKLCLPIPNELNIAHDNWLHQCAFCVNRKSVMREVLALYRRHASNTTATGNLNVDFITSPNHFNNNLKLLNTKTLLNSKKNRYIIQWLNKNKKTLAKRGYETIENIEYIISTLNIETEIIINRNNINSISRLKRLTPIIHLYLKGGYDKFSGWKSAIKDLLIN
jgi:glycosyltransferase involved in cell wall biosynthesis